MSVERTKTTVANLALREIGTYRIEDFDEDSADAEVVRDLWDETLRECLAAHEWQFAKKQAALEQGDAPIARYDYTYRLPSDYIRLMGVSDRDTMESGFTAWDIIYTDGEPIPTIISDSESIYIEYVHFLEEPAAWAPHFVPYFVTVLASKLAAPLKSTIERNRLEEKAEKVALPKARSQDSVLQPARKPPMGSWIRAMRMGHGST